MTGAKQRQQEPAPGVPGDRSQAQDSGDPEGRVSDSDVKEAFQKEDTPTSRLVEPVPDGEKHDQLAEHVDLAEDRQEALLDEGLEESFPASDLVSVKRVT